MKHLALAFRQTIASLPMVGLIYALTLGLALLVALPLYSTLTTEAQGSLAFLNLLSGFDYTVVTDFMKRSGPAVKAVFGAVRWLNLTYLLLTIFLTGGILLRFAQLTSLQDRPLGAGSRFRAGLFWEGCSHYVGRMLRLFGVTLLFVLVTGIIWIIIGILVGGAVSSEYSEREVFGVSILFFGLFAVTTTLLLCIGDFAKVLLFRADAHGAFRAFGQAGRFVLANPLRTYGPYLLFILIGTGFFALYFLLENMLPVDGWLMIAVLFVIQQVLIAVRVGLKVGWLGTAYGIAQTLPQPAVRVQEPQPIQQPIREQPDEL
ncbi:hypothetical protein [Spirosoma rhododendri]|uniref:DUF975 family protein n=1 Tax=Spirosoma rhododendri TaxID=2728024 RepID=A0A7L5DJQ3_9BACT|nr:hypothetical protein [Spirosoma rhododendri]QJD77701.1 hypothetical protein HH216_04160 [Spirosoma rhododendri]